MEPPRFVAGEDVALVAARSTTVKPVLHSEPLRAEIVQTQYASLWRRGLAKEEKRIQTADVAIQFARARYISRSTGGSAVRSAAYNAREAIEAERTGELFYFRHRDAPRAPRGAPPGRARPSSCATARCFGTLRRQRSAAKTRRSHVRSCSRCHRTESCQRRIGSRSPASSPRRISSRKAWRCSSTSMRRTRPAKADESERANWHAHLLITTRRVEGEGFAAKKARDLDPVVRQAGTRAYVTDAEAWGELWRTHQERYFQEHGYDIGVDPTAPHAGEHIGPVRMRKAGSAAGERAETLRTANENAARDPEQVLAALTRNNATFTERDLDRFLRKHLAPEEITGTKAAVLGKCGTSCRCTSARQAMRLARFTTRQVRAQEEAALADARMVAAARHHRGVSARSVSAATTSRSLRAGSARGVRPRDRGGWPA